MSLATTDKSDILFIGSGLSSSYTLKKLLNRLINLETTKVLSIAIVDKYHEFYSGIPYGNRSGFSTLLITSLENFLPEPELSKFLIWLGNNKNWLLTQFEKEGGALSKKWLADNDLELKENKWKELFIPRAFFGCYLSEKLSTTIKILTEQKKIQVTHIKGEAVDITKQEEDFAVKLTSGVVLESSRVVMSVGSLPSKKLWIEKQDFEDDHLLFINDPYYPELTKNIQRINQFVSKRNGEKTNILIIGANASGLEMLYKLNDNYAPFSKDIDYQFLSTQGIAPDSEVNFKGQKKFQPDHLIKLQSKNKLTAEEIAVATFNDLDVAERDSLGAASTVGIVSSAFGSLFNKLNDTELKDFACYYGNEIGRRQRCAGNHYSNTINELKKSDQFDHVAGRFSQLLKDSDGGYKYKYLETSTQTQVISDINVHVVINCVGSMLISNPEIPQLIKNLINKKLITANESEIGFDVNGSLEASENLYIVGPLLAGNIIESKPVWHVEHCGRIIWLSDILSKTIINSWTKDNLVVNDQKLRILNLSADKDKTIYENIICKEWQSNPYYLYDYFSHHNENTHELLAFELYNSQTSLAIMPMVKRTIPNTNNNYYDIISPYGYNGPIFKPGIPDSIKTIFWKEVDNWSKRNNIVTEFIRFNLNGNQLHYSGTLVPTLNNVAGHLNNSFEENWDKFLPKVRNNYRKACSFNLKIEILKGSEITAEKIATFYSIYLETMKRNDASEFLYFSQGYFENLILNNNDSFALAIVSKENIPISTELLIMNEYFLHAFLGGTLAAYFNCRPNDFLRVEIIKWAIDQGFNTYMLGGGMQNNDSLYKSKKALFPKDSDRTFYTGRKILNPQIYEELNKSINNQVVDNSFFPKYRSK